MFVKERSRMRASRQTQALSYDLRVPDEAQADALRLLEASRMVVNTALVALWPQLDALLEKGEREQPAWKQVTAMLASPDPHGSRQWRCEAETVGRILRAQASRKRVFLAIAPILSDGFIRPKDEKRPAGKNRPAIKQTLAALQRENEEDESAFVGMQNVVEQACNHFVQHGSFPRTYEEMQPVPLLKTGLLAYAGDDGPRLGQSYRLSLDLEAGTAALRFRFPDEAGTWQWREQSVVLALPACVLARLKQGESLAPTLREHALPDGSRIAVLDLAVAAPKAKLPAWETTERVLGFDWGVHTLITAVVLDAEQGQVGRPFFLHTGGLEGKQARTRREIDRLKAARDRLPSEDAGRKWLEQEIARCWGKYEARNRELAHLAANVLLLLAAVYNCQLIAGESLKTLKSTGRGRGVRGRWRNWRNNATIRGEIWHILRYKCHLAGIRFRSEKPGETSHTCPRCGKPARTLRSPRREHQHKAFKWGRWLRCTTCKYTADRDYAAAVNIARLAVTFVTQLQATGKAQAFSVADASVKPVPYMAAGAVLLLPPQVPRDRLLHAGKIYKNGWRKTATLRTSYAAETLLRLCG
jgi:putative transposase